MARKTANGNAPPATGVLLLVRVTPRGGRDDGFHVVGFHVVRVSALPAEGAANRACIRLMANAPLGIKKSEARLIGGDKSRDKRFILDGVTASGCNKRLAAFPRITGSDDGNHERPA